MSTLQEYSYIVKQFNTCVLIPQAYYIIQQFLTNVIIHVDFADSLYKTAKFFEQIPYETVEKAKFCTGDS